MKKLIFILFIIFIACSQSKQTFINQTMIPSSELEFKIEVNNSEFGKIKRKYKRAGYILIYKKSGRDNYIIYFNQEQIEATRKNKGKYSILPKRFDNRIRNAIMDEIQ